MPTLVYGNRRCANATLDSKDKTLRKALKMLPHRVRNHLCEIEQSALPITYQALAKALDLSPPNTIHQLTIALEKLIEEDVAADRPLIAALVISKARGGLPAPGFFICAKRMGKLEGDTDGTNPAAFFEAEFNKAVRFWHNQYTP